MSESVTFVFDEDRHWWTVVPTDESRWSPREPKRAEADYFNHRQWWDNHIESLPEHRAQIVRRSLKLPAPDRVMRSVKARRKRNEETGAPL